MKDKLIKLLTESDILCDYCGQHGNTYCIEALAEYLANKGVTIPVRCKDCKGMNEDKFCVAWEGFVRENDFCSYGERK